MKFAFVARHRQTWPVSWLSEVLEVSRSACHPELKRLTIIPEIKDA